MTVEGGFQRRQYQVALVGEEALTHRELLERAGYSTIGASDGSEAATLFSGMDIIDVVVLDFAISGRPPEAILLFARDVLTSAPLIGLVPANKDEGFRRAFMAGARDVLPSPTRGEDLLDAIDLVLEPNYLSALVAELRGGEQAEGLHFGQTDPSDNSARVEALELERDRLQQLLAQTEKAHQNELARAEQDLASMRNSWRDLQGKEVQSRRENNALARKVRDANSDAERTGAQNKELTRITDRARQERDRLKEELDALRSEIALLEEEAASGESPHRLSRGSADLLVKAELTRLKDEHAEVQGKLDAVQVERDGLARQLRGVQRELADAETRLEEVSGAIEELEGLRNELRAEQASHALTRRRYESVSRVVNRAQQEAAEAVEMVTGNPDGFDDDSLPVRAVDKVALKGEMEREATVHDETTLSKYIPPAS
jgi:CheY-like chemotaxis protein